MPVTQFAAVTPFGALVWIGGIFIITKLLGSQALIGFSFLQGKIAAIVFTAFFLTATLFLLKRLVTDGRDGSPSRPLGASHGAARPAVAPYHAVSKAGTCSRSQKMALARIDQALDALEVLAGVAVLHPAGRLLAVAGDSPSRPECADFGKSRNRDRWLYRGIEVGDARSTSP